VNPARSFLTSPQDVSDPAGNHLMSVQDMSQPEALSPPSALRGHYATITPRRRNAQVMLLGKSLLAMFFELWIEQGIALLIQYQFCDFDADLK